MIARKRKAILLLLIVVFHDVFAVHHWRISDDGKKIVAVPMSPFNLGYPGSLPEFLRQIESVKASGKTYQELGNILNSIEKRQELDEPNIEERVRKNDPFCQRSAGLPLSKNLFRTSLSPEICPEFVRVNTELLNKVRSFEIPSSSASLPFCGEYYAKSKFPMEEQLPDFYHSQLGERYPDEEYTKVLKTYFPGISQFDSSDIRRAGLFLAQLIAAEEKGISNHPYVHLAAAAFWRVDGNAQEAMNCYRTALTVLYAGRWIDEVKLQLQQTIQIAAATLLNYVEKPEEGAVLLEYFHEAQFPLAAPLCRLVILHVASADILLSSEEKEKSNMATMLMKRVERAMQDYEQALQIEKRMSEKERKAMPDWSLFLSVIQDKYALLACQLAITNELEQQRENLEKLLREKEHYNEVFGERLKHEQDILSRLALPDKRHNLRMSYDFVKYAENPHRNCGNVQAKRFPQSKKEDMSAFICITKKLEKYEEYMMPMRKATVSSRPPLNDMLRLAELYPKDRSFEKKLKQLKETLTFEPTLPQKYPLSSSSFSQLKDRFWRRTDWPNSVDCQAIMSKTDIFNQNSLPQLFISPEDKGFHVAELLTKFLGMEMGDEHPLPWNEPFCKELKMEGNPFSPYPTIRTIISIQGFDRKYAEPELKTVLLQLADRPMEDAEMGQRIRSLLEHEIGPKWLVLNLAGLYWRVKGYPSQAAHCLMQSVLTNPNSSDLALFQLAQVIFKATGQKEETLEFFSMAAGVDKEHPYLSWLQGRVELLASNVDAAMYHLKDALDKNPFNKRIAEDLLKVACSGKSTKQAISSQFPTVCCSNSVQNAVCFKLGGDEQCYVVDSSSGRLIYNRCNGIYTSLSYPTSPFVSIVSPFLSIFQMVQKREMPPFGDDVGAAQSIETEELPLDYGGSELFFAPRPIEWWSRAENEMVYKRTTEKESPDEWEELSEANLAPIPPKPLSFLWVKEKREMLRWDVSLPEILPTPTLQQIRKGIHVFPAPRQTSNVCNGVRKLSVLLENQVSTWVSVTAKGEDIEKYVDLRGPVPGIAGLLPVCPSIEKTDGSPILGMDHIPAFALSDQFLFYKPEKMLTDALKLLGNERDTIEHVAARLHTAMLASSMGQHGSVNWLLCVLSSLYWRVVGDAPRAVGCLQCALQTAPPHMRDVVLISLANICHQAGLLHSALVVASAALSVSPNLVAIHFTIANIYASIGDYERALEFYYSTLSLQSSFDPAKERIRAIYCHSGRSFPAFQNS